MFWAYLAGGTPLTGILIYLLGMVAWTACTIWPFKQVLIVTALLAVIAWAWLTR